MMRTDVSSPRWIEAPTERTSTRIRSWTGLIWSLIGGLALVAVWSVMYTTPWGTGTGWDQAMYIGAARDLLAGRGLTIAWGADVGKPLTHFPPLYPTALALGGLSGWDPWSVARYLNAALRGIDLLLVSLLAWQVGRRSHAAALIAAFLMLTSVHMEFVHGSAWSEPLFMVLALPSLALLARSIVSGSTTALIGASVFAAAAILTRYAGLMLLPVGVLLLLWARRPKAAAGFAAITGVPLGAWLAHNLLGGNQVAGDRAVTWYGIPPEQFGQALFTVLDWVLPTNVVMHLVSPAGAVQRAGAAVLVVLLAGLGWLIWRGRSARRAGSATTADTADTAEVEAATLTRVLVVFVALYPVGILVSRLLFDDLVQFDSRILSPVLVSLIVLVSGWAARALARRWKGWWRPLIAIAVVGVATVYTVRSGTLIARAHAQGVIYSNTDWLDSATLAHVRELPADTTVFSNAPDAVYILDNRSSFEVPDVGHADSFLGVLRDTVRAAPGPVAVVYFGDPNIAYRRPVPVEMIENVLPTRLVAESPDGAVYEVDTAPNEVTH